MNFRLEGAIRRREISLSKVDYCNGNLAMSSLVLDKRVEKHLLEKCWPKPGFYRVQYPFPLHTLPPGPPSFSTLSQFLLGEQVEGVSLDVGSSP